jgi:hypothetical protein
MRAGLMKRGEAVRVTGPTITLGVWAGGIAGGWKKWACCRETGGGGSEDVGELLNGGKLDVADGRNG